MILDYLLHNLDRNLFKILKFCQRMAFEQMFNLDITTCPGFSAHNPARVNHQALYYGFIQHQLQRNVAPEHSNLG